MARSYRSRPGSRRPSFGAGRCDLNSCHRRQRTLKDQAGTISGTYPILPKSVSNGRITEVTLIAGEPIQLEIRFTPARPSTQPAQPQRQNGFEATTSPSFMYVNVNTVKCKRRVLETVEEFETSKARKNKESHFKWLGECRSRSWGMVWR